MRKRPLSTRSPKNSKREDKNHNLCATIDVNRLGQSEPTMDQHDMEEYRRRWDAFGWNALVVDGHGRVKVKTNWYSTPLWPGLRVTARVWPSRVEIEHDGECVARHQRCYGRGHQILNLEHYLDVLEKKPGAMEGSTPLEQWRQAGRWPECLDQIWKKLEQRHGRGGGTREMISLVRAGLNDGWDRLIAAVQEALRLGVTDTAAVMHILRMPDAEERRRYQISLSEELAEFERPQPVLDEYDLLLAAPLPGKGVIQ